MDVEMTDVFKRKKDDKPFEINLRDTAAWIEEIINRDVFYIGGKEHKSRLLHCFGSSPRDVISPDTAVDLIRITGTEFLTIYTHGVLPKNIKDFPIGYAGLTFSDIVNRLDLSRYTLLINTNYAKTASEAVERAEYAADVTGTDIIKLEVLPHGTNQPIDKEVVEAAKILLKRGYRVLPIINRDIAIAKELEEIGCSAVRVLMSEIGSMKGLIDLPFFERLRKEVNIPIIAEGGVSSPTDIYLVMAAGIDAVLVNKALFLTNNILLTAKAMREATIAGRLNFLAKN